MTKRRKNHRFVSVPKGNTRKRKNGQTKSVRVGARNHGSMSQGSIRRPF